MGKTEIMLDAFDKFKSSHSSLSDKDYFFAGWDACENVWLTDEPDKDLMISELEGELECAKNKNYEKEYISLYKRSTRYLSILAQISTAQGNDNLSETKKLEHIRKLLDKVSNNKINEEL
jgi:hypothetical protein